MRRLSTVVDKDTVSQLQKEHNALGADQVKSSSSSERSITSMKQLKRKKRDSLIENFKRQLGEAIKESSLLSTIAHNDFKA